MVQLMFGSLVTTFAITAITASVLALKHFKFVSYLDYKILVTFNIYLKYCMLYTSNFIFYLEA